MGGPRDVKFSVKCLFKTKLQLKNDKIKNKNNKNNDKQKDNPLIETELPYILDFELGPPKTPDLDTSNTPSSTIKSNSNQQQKPTATPSQNQNQPNDNQD